MPRGAIVTSVPIELIITAIVSFCLGGLIVFMLKAYLKPTDETLRLIGQLLLNTYGRISDALKDGEITADEWRAIAKSTLTELAAILKTLKDDGLLDTEVIYKTRPIDLEGEE